eukprot:TRINITY_DN66253_c0_g1_i1.p1 TRINITY_DN66253_c0_g1~~TRINITY_DN66253_c0_g1_i1.p1  ORF type:complete len:1122 (+),score=283.55 TRINITY_DN66253_c0_g1_i1:101-3367(+)
MADQPSPGKAALRHRVEAEEWEAAEPVSLHSEAELKRELIEIGGLCADAKNPEWAKRVRALQRFRSLLAGGASDFPGFLQLMREYMKDPLNAAIQDLRSAVAKEACWSVMALCKELPGHTWEPMGDWFLSSLFKITIITIAIISHSAGRCLRYIFNNSVLTSRMRSIILDPANIEAKHSMYRQRVYGALFTVVHRVSPGELSDREVEAIVRAISRGFSDPMPEIRRIARFLFWGFHRLDPRRANRLLERQESTTQRLVHDDRAAYDAMDKDVDIEVSSSKSGSVASGGVVSRRTAQGDGEQDGGRSPAASSAAQRSATAHPASPQPRRRSIQRSTTPLQRKASRDRMRVSPAAAPRHAAADSAEPADAAEGAPLQRAGSRPGTASRPGSLRRLSPHARKGSDRQLLRPPQIAPAERISDTSQQCSSWDEVSPEHHSSASNSSVNRPRGLVDSPQTLDSSLATADAADWTERVRSFDALTAMTGDPAAWMKLRGGLDHALNVIIDHLCDNHYRVVLAALSCATAIVLQAHSCGDDGVYSSHLERLCVNVLRWLAPPTKDVVRQRAQELLQVLLDLVPPARLFPVLYKVLDTNNSKVQIGCCEFAYWVVHRKEPVCRDYFGVPANTRMALQKFLYVSATDNKDVRRAAANLLQALYRCQPLVFCQMVLQCSSSDQHAVRTFLSKVIPTFGEEMQTLQMYGPEAAEQLFRRHISGYDPHPQPCGPPPLESPKPIRSVQGAARLPPHAPVAAEKHPLGIERDAARHAQGAGGSSVHTDPTVHLRRLSQPRPDGSLHRAGSSGTLASESRSGHVHSSPAERAWLALADVDTPSELRAREANYLATEFAEKRTPWPNQQLTEVLCGQSQSGRCLLELARDTKLPSELRCDSLRLAAYLCPQSGNYQYYTRFFYDVVTLYLDPDRDVSQASEEAMQLVLNQLPPRDNVDLLGKELQAAIKDHGWGLDRGVVSGSWVADDVLPWLLKLLEDQIARLGRESNVKDVVAATSGLLSSLYTSVGSEKAEVRKAGFFCFVTLYMVLGSQAVPMLRPLSTGQLKLVTVYVNRRRGEQGLDENVDLGITLGRVLQEGDRGGA